MIKMNWEFQLYIKISISQKHRNIKLVDTIIPSSNRTINNHVSVSVHVAINQYLRAFVRLNSWNVRIHIDRSIITQ